MTAHRLVIAAQSISSGLLASLDPSGTEHGTLCALHHRALNILWRRQLISVVAPQMGAFPNAMVASVDGVAETLRVGERVSRVPEGLIVEGAYPVLFDLNQAVRWSPLLKPAAPAGGWCALAGRLRFVLRRAAPHAGHQGFGPLLAALKPASVSIPLESMPALCRYAIGTIAALVHALGESDARGLAMHAGALSGLGCGLTPSGDDLLVGMLAALAGAADPRAELLARAVLAIPPNRTTLLAHTLLRYACAFMFSSRLHELIGALFAADAHGLEHSALTALAWGESSGADSLLGVVLGLDVVLSRRGARGAPKLALRAPIN